MTDVVPYSESAQRPPREWVGLFPAAAELAAAVAGTEFVPSALRNNVPATTAAILYGDEVGLGPMQSLSKVAVIKGRPSLAAESQRALILSQGHHLWLEETTITKATWCGARRESPEKVTRITWTMDDATRAGLAGQQAYRTYPRAMLSARASAELARTLFPDVIAGLGAIEEADDGFTPGGTPDADPGAPAPPAPAKTTRRRTKRATPPPAAQVSPPQPPAEAELPALPGEEEPERGATLPFPNWYAMKLNELGLSNDPRHGLTLALSKGRTETSSDLNGEETAQARALIEEGRDAIIEFVQAYEAAQEEGPESDATGAAPPDPEDAGPATPDPAPEPVDEPSEPEDAEVIISSSDELRDLMKSKGIRTSDVLRKAGAGVDPKFAPRTLDDVVRNGEILVTVLAWLEEVQP